MHPGRTVGAGPGCNAIGHGQFVGHSGGVIVPDVQGHDSAAPVDGEIAVHRDAGNNIKDHPESG